MKIKLYTIFWIIILVLTSFLHKSYAADSTQLNLPENAKYRLGKGKISKIKFSPDGSRIAAVSSIGIWIYNTHSGKEMYLILNPESGVTSVAFSPNGLKLALIGWWTIQISDIETGKSHIPMSSGGLIRNASFSPDGQTLASACRDKIIRVWDVQTGKRKQMLIGHTDEVESVTFSPDGRTIASAGDDNTIRLWSVETGEQKSILTEHAKDIDNLFFSSGKQNIVSVGKDSTFQLWDAETGAKKHTFTPRDPTEGITSVAFSPNVSTIVTVNDNKTIQLWDRVAEKHKYTFRGEAGRITDLDFSPNAQMIASISDDNTIRLWNVETGKRFQIQTEEWHTQTVSSLTFSPDGKIFATSSEDKTIMVWDTDTGKHKYTLYGHTGKVYSVAFSPDGKTIASSGQYSIRLWNAKTGRCHKTLMTPRTKNRHNGDVYSITFSPDGETIATCSEDKTIRLWYARTGLHYRTITKNSGSFHGVGFSPDGKTLISASRGSEDTIIRLWETETRVLKHTFSSNMRSVNSSSFSPDGKTIAIATHDNTIELLDVATAKLKQSLATTEDVDNIECVAFSPNGKIIVGCTNNRKILLWNTKTLEHIRTFTGHKGTITNGAFNPDGRTIASASSDGTVIVWDISSSVINLDATVRLFPSTIQISSIGQKLTFSLNIIEGEIVAGYQATIDFDPTVLRYVESKNGDYLSSDAYFVQPIVKKNNVTVAATTHGTESKGDGTLATLTFEVIAINNSTLKLSNVLLTDSVGISSHPRIENSKITKPAAPTILKEDVNGDGVVNNLDLESVAESLGILGNNRSDVNEDGVVNIADLTLIQKAIEKANTVPSSNDK